MLYRILSHARRIGYQLGWPVRAGRRSLRVPGFFASRLETNVDRHEAFMVDVIRRHLEAREGAFIDVGVNVGQTLLKVLSIDFERRYIGFEPQVSCCYNLLTFIRMNALNNASIFPVALSDANSVLRFYTHSQYDEMASLVASRASAASVTYAQARIGDEILQELETDRIAVIKIDVEGAELQVLRGLQETLRRLRLPVIFEVLPNFFGVKRRVRREAAACITNRASANAMFAALLSL